MLLAFAAAAFPGVAVSATATVPVVEGAFPKGRFQEELIYTAAPGEVNRLVVAEDAPGQFRLTDAGATISAGERCRSIDARTVVCAAKRLGAALLGDRDDAARLSLPARQLPTKQGPAAKAVVFGGPGNDAITQIVVGSPGRGRGSNFTNQGTFRGTFSARGDAGDDVISGSAGGDILQGGAGRDYIAGNGGDDVVAGGKDDDDLRGGRGADFVLGSDLDAFDFGQRQPPDRDVLDGGPGPDLLAGGPGSDRILGGAGRDTLLYSRSLGLSRRPPRRVVVTFDGRANDGPRGERDNALRPDLESLISVGSGSFSISESVVLRAGTYQIAGGTSAQATILILSTRGTRAAQTGTFAGASFTLRPGRLRGPVTDVTATGGNFRRCRAGASASDARTAARRSRRRVRRLFGRAKGRFRSRGRSSATLVRGTAWEMIDRCDGTLTKVTEGTVAVRDFGRRRTVTVRAGGSYLARATR